MKLLLLSIILLVRFCYFLANNPAEFEEDLVSTSTHEYLRQIVGHIVQEPQPKSNAI